MKRLVSLMVSVVFALSFAGAVMAQQGRPLRIEIRGIHGRNDVASREYVMRYVEYYFPGQYYLAQERNRDQVTTLSIEVSENRQGQSENYSLWKDIANEGVRQGTYYVGRNVPLGYIIRSRRNGVFNPYSYESVSSVAVSANFNDPGRARPYASEHTYDYRKTAQNQRVSGAKDRIEELPQQGEPTLHPAWYPNGNLNPDTQKDLIAVAKELKRLLPNVR